jgi:hypothetical protein
MNDGWFSSRLAVPTGAEPVCLGRRLMDSRSLPREFAPPPMIEKRLGRPLSSCPGLTIMARQGRREAWWIARRDLCSRGFEPATVRLNPDPPTDMDGPARDALSMERCTGLWADMLAWANGKLLRPYERWDGPIGSLARIYQSHPDSPFHGCVPGTQKTTCPTARISSAPSASGPSAR